MAKFVTLDQCEETIEFFSCSDVGRASFQSRYLNNITNVYVQESDFEYDEYLRELQAIEPWRTRYRVRRLCESGLISDGRRTSLDAKQIDNRYKVDRAMLAALVDRRLLRTETRVDRRYFELARSPRLEGKKLGS